MKTQKLLPGSEFPPLLVKSQQDELVDISKPTADASWQMIVVYRGSHCPKCTDFLNKLAGYRPQLLDAGIDLAAVSVDNKELMNAHLEQLDINFPLYYGMTLEQCDELGLYISEPAPWGDSKIEFPEPALFIINPDGQLQNVEMANNPFIRPDLELLVPGLIWMTDPKVNYPIRGTYNRA